MQGLASDRGRGAQQRRTPSAAAAAAAEPGRRPRVRQLPTNCAPSAGFVPIPGGRRQSQRCGPVYGLQQRFESVEADEGPGPVGRCKVFAIRPPVSVSVLVAVSPVPFSPQSQVLALPVLFFVLPLWTAS